MVRFKPAKVHFHVCVDCIERTQVRCTAILGTHASRCKPHDDEHTHKLLFETPFFGTGGF